MLFPLLCFSHQAASLPHSVDCTRISQVYIEQVVFLLFFSSPLLSIFTWCGCYCSGSFITMPPWTTTTTTEKPPTRSTHMICNKTTLFFEISVLWHMWAIASGAGRKRVAGKSMNIFIQSLLSVWKDRQLQRNQKTLNENWLWFFFGSKEQRNYTTIR